MFFNSQAFSRFVAATSVLLLAMSLLTIPVAAQTSTAGTVVGNVTDPQGAVVPGADVTLKNNGTNETATGRSNDQGGFIFPNVTPGAYTLTVTAKGFRTTTIPNLAVDANKSSNVPVQLSVGATNETVEVQASSATELQTTDAQIGNVITTESVMKLPSLQRNVTELMNLQPGVSPGANLGMRTTGAIDDQNTVKLDGIDITANVVASRTVVPTPADSVEEFRVAVSNPSQDLNRSSGGQMTLVERHGSNTFHGSVYWYHQNDDLNTNTWDNNFSHIKKPELKDNRYGARFGGPVWKNKTFFFGMYEGRRFAQVSQVTRAVPTDTLKQGILQFRDNNGTVQQINLKTASICGPSGNALCDPRGLGISPYTKAFWQLMPSGNIAAAGTDGLNTTGFLANIPTPVKDDYSTFRLDHNFGEKLKYNGTYTYFRDLVTSNGEISIIGGTGKSVRTAPQRGELISSALTWQVSPTLLNVFRFGYVWNRDAGNAQVPTVSATQLALAGTNTSAGYVAALPASNQSNGTAANTNGGLDSPIDMDTQRARFQSNNDKDIQYIDDVTWIHGTHSITFGGQVNHLPYTHVRGDKVIGSVTSLVATMDANNPGSGTFLSIPGTNTPLTCSTSQATNCIRASDINIYQRLYAATLGLLDQVSILAVKDANLNPLPLGTNLTNITNQTAYYFYGQDSWRASPSFTLTYGLSYGWQAPPSESQNRQTIMIDATSGQPFDAVTFLRQKEQAALQGQIFNPTVGYQSVGNAHRKVFDTDWSNVAPRVAFAWNPSDKVPIFGRLLGDKKTVIRGGYAEIYDRSNTVQSVEIPMLGVGFDQNVNVKTPSCNANGAGGAGCNAGAGVATNPGAASFRVGVDGSIPLPVVPAVSFPVIPPGSTGNTTTGFTETLSFQVDPRTKIGRSYNVDLGFQRDLPGGMVWEAAYAGRFARHLPQAVNFNQSPYMFKDSASGQTFAQAFDAVATQLRGGTTVANVTPQPWFENQLKGIVATGSATTALLSGGRVNNNAFGGQSGNFVTGNVATIFQTMGFIRRSLGLLPYNNDQASVEFMRTYIGQSNYNGLLMSLRSRLTHGLQYSVNYTFSKTLDDNISNQNNAGFYGNSFHPGVDYGPSTFDRTHIINANYVYDLPAGRGHRFASGNGFLEHIFGGWFNSGIVSYATGLPLFVSQGVNAFGGGLTLAPNTTAPPVVLGTLPGTGLNSNTAGSNGTGTSTTTKKNIFADPAGAYTQFRRYLLSVDQRSGRGQPMRGLGFWNVDTTVGKDTSITERIKFRFTFDFFNVFNHPNFNTPSPSITNQGGFGVISSTNTLSNRNNSARWIEFGARIEF